MSPLLIAICEAVVGGAMVLLARRIVDDVESVALQWKWFDLWVGLFIDKPNRTWYVCLVPTVVLKIKLRGRR